MVHHKPILDLSLPFLISGAGGLGQVEVTHNPAEHYAHLHHRQILTRTDRWAV